MTKTPKDETPNKPAPDTGDKGKTPGQREPFGRVKDLSRDETEDLARAVEEQRDA